MTLGLLITLQKQMHSVRPISIHPRLHLNSCKSRIKTKKLQLMTRRAHTSETKYKKKTPEELLPYQKGVAQADQKGLPCLSLGLQLKGHSLFGWRHEPLFLIWDGGWSESRVYPSAWNTEINDSRWWSSYKSHLVPGLTLAEAAFLVVRSRLGLN